MKASVQWFSWMLGTLKSSAVIAVGISVRGWSLPWYFTVEVSLSAWYYRKKIYIHAHYLGRRCIVFSLSAADCDSWQQRCTGEAAWCIWNQHLCDLPAISLWILAHFCLMNISWSRSNSWCTYPTAIITHTPSFPHPLHSTPKHKHPHTLLLNLSLVLTPHLETPNVFNNQ